jgi:hypothetical protein
MLPSEPCDVDSVPERMLAPHDALLSHVFSRWSTPIRYTPARGEQHPCKPHGCVEAYPLMEEIAALMDANYKRSRVAPTNSRVLSYLTMAPHCLILRLLRYAQTRGLLMLHVVAEGGTPA